MRIIGSGYDGDLNLTSVTVEEDGQEYRFEKPRWISVKEKLPEMGVNVPVIFSDGYVGMGQWLGWGWCGYVYRTTNDVTHWMPLPSAEGLHDN